jgi:translation initiation factor IF-1
MSSKLQLIKSKCMNGHPRLGKSDSKKTLNSVWMDN